MSHKNKRHWWAVFYRGVPYFEPLSLEETRRAARNSVCWVTRTNWEESRRMGFEVRKVTVIDGWRDVAKEGE